jgi:peptide/nickel transport system substrate-binding protein
LKILSVRKDASVSGKTTVICLLIFVMLLAACNHPEAEEKQSETGLAAAGAYEVDVIRLAGGDWGYPSPFAHYPRGPGGFKMCLIFDSLLERDEKGLIPWLAERYAVEDGGRTYRFFIRRGVRWQDGRPLTPEDVAFSLDYANRHAATWSYIFDAIETVTVDADHSVGVRLKAPRAAMLDHIGRTRIIPRHIWEGIERPKEFTAPEAVIGSGPYRLAHYSKAHGTYRFEAFEDFWGPRPRVGAIEFIPVSEPILAYEKGEIDLTAVTPDVQPRFADNPDHRIVRSPAFWGYRLLLNMEQVPAFREVTVRQAFVYAIDRRELVDKIARGAAVPGRPGILPPDHVMAVETRTYPFDPAQARKLLDQAGCRIPEGAKTRVSPDGQSLALELLCSSTEVRLAELIRQRLQDVGLPLSIRSVDSKTRDARVRSRDYQIAILGHGGWGGDPDYLMARFAPVAAGGNAAPSHAGLPGLAAPRLMDLLQRQQTATDPQERRRLVAALQQELAEQVPEIPLFCTTGTTIYRPAKYDGWMFMFDHHSLPHSKLSYLERTGLAVKR